MQESEEQKDGGNSPMGEFTIELSTECSASVTDGTRASSGSPPSEIASMSPTGTSTSRDHEWVCEQNGCGKSFSNRDKLRWHKRCHDKPHKCLYPVCVSEGVVFSLKKDLVRHQEAKHGGQRFYCEYYGCEYAIDGRKDGFSRKDNLARHIVNQHPAVAEDEQAVLNSRGGA